VRLRLALVPAVAACLAGAAGITAHFGLRDAAATLSGDTGMEADAPDRPATDLPATPSPTILPPTASSAEDPPAGMRTDIAAEESGPQAEPAGQPSEAIHVGGHAGTFLPGSALPGPELHPETGTDSAPSIADGTGTVEEEAENPLTRLVVSVGNGGTLSGVLGHAGVPTEQANGAIDALRSVFNPRKLKAGQEITVIFENGDDDRVFVGLEFEPDVDRAVAVAREGDAYEAVEIEKTLERRLVASDALISSSLFEAGAEAGVPIPVMIQMIRAFSYDVDFQRDIQPGDGFSVMYEREFAEDGNPVREGEIVFASLALSGKELSLYRYTTRDGETDYFNRRGESVRKALLRTPVDGARISSSYGMRRHPILAYSKMHKGVDFAAPTGTPVYAAGNGTIDEAGSKGSYGNYIRIRHNREISTAYAHLSRISKDVRRGSKVRQGDVIGFVGTTGRSTGPHLHYEVLRNGRQANPMSVDLPTGIVLAGRDLAAFKQMVEKVDAQFAELMAERQIAQNPDDTAVLQPAGGTGIPIAGD
jgi:murein DD-endopeptidase MepM/ murein hydrolase activator NlpD